MSELLSQFHFLRPLWLLAIVPALGLALLLIRRGDREGNWARAVAPELLVHLLDGQDLKRSRHAVALLLGAWCLAAVAAAGPSWQQLPRPVLQKQDALVIVMDLSYSMLATDLQPSRVDRMRRKLQDLLGQRREGLSALVAYAGDAHVVAPLTDDNRTIANLLPALEPSMMPVPGSNAPEALQRALDLLRSAGIRSGRVLLVTDGVADGDRDRLANMLLESSHRLAILGVGTEVGAPIPLPKGGFLKDDRGEIVVPPLTEPGLRDLAGRVNGAYRRLRVDDDDLTGLLSATASLLDEESINRDRDADEWQDMGHWFVLPLLLGCLLSFRRGTLYGLTLLLMLPAPASRASLWDDLWQTRDQQAAEALAAGDAEKAATLFEAPQWRGTAAWETKDYEAAQEAFAAGSDADAWYNRGNALAAQGRLEEAIDAYQQSLTLAPGAEDARRNIDTLKELLEQQQQEQQQKQQQEQQEQQEQQQDQQSRSPQQGDSAQNDGEQGDSNSGDSAPQNPGSDEPQENASGDPQAQDPEGEGEEQDPQQSEDARQGDGDEGEDAQPINPQIDNSAMQESLERDQALQQWLRRVPDDPSGLLREKFRYESRQRQQQGETRNRDQIW